MNLNPPLLTTCRHSDVQRSKDMRLCLCTRLIMDQKTRTRSVGKKLTPTADGSALMVAYPMVALIALEMTLLWSVASLATLRR